MSNSDPHASPDEPFYKKKGVLIPVALLFVSKLGRKSLSALRTRRRRKAMKELRKQQRTRQRAQRQRAAAKRKVKRQLFS